MKRVIFFIFLFGIAFILSKCSFAQNAENSSAEFLIVKNESSKSVFITFIFSVVVPDGVSLSNINKEAKKQLVNEFVLSDIILKNQENEWDITCIGTNEKGEFFESNIDASNRRNRIICDFKKKGYTITSYPFNYSNSSAVTSKYF